MSNKELQVLKPITPQELVQTMFLSVGLQQVTHEQLVNLIQSLCMKDNAEEIVTSISAPSGFIKKHYSVETGIYYTYLHNGN